MSQPVRDPIASIFTKAAKGDALTLQDHAALAVRRAGGRPYALPDDAAALGYVVCEHPGHMDALGDLATDLAAQSRLPVTMIWRALSAFSSRAERQAMSAAH